MKRRLGLLLPLALGSCIGTPLYRDLSAPLTVEDFEPIPAPVTPENAMLVVRRCLQIHRRSASTAEEEWGYAFVPSGFVQLFHARPPEREEERAARIYVEYRDIQEVQAEPHYSLIRLREEFHVTLRGKFRRWDEHLRTFRAQPDLGAEASTAPAPWVRIVFDDAVAAHRLREALQLLRGG